MPRGRPKLGKTIAKQAALADASNRLKLIEKAGFNQDKQAAVLAKILTKADEMLDNPDLDPFAKAAWAKLVIRDILDLRPPKLPGSGSGAQTPVVINIGELPPAPTREPRNVTPRSDGPQARAAISLPPNPA